ncbi:hypothetical protein EBZ39_01305 [bacterium]|nr:hypothetical protein [bacterium]
MKINEELVKYGAALAQRTKQADPFDGLGAAAGPVAGALAGLLAGGAHGYLAPGEETLYDDRGREIGKKPRDRMTTALLRALVGGAGGGAAGALLQHTGAGKLIKDKATGAASALTDSLNALLGRKSRTPQSIGGKPQTAGEFRAAVGEEPFDASLPANDSVGTKTNPSSPRTAQSIGGKPQSYDEYRAAVGEEPSGPRRPFDGPDEE